MLHQPAATFEPSQPAPTTAQPFDAKRYLQRARELGLMVYPSIAQSGRKLVGYHSYPGYSFGRGHRRLCEEFDDIKSTAAIFDALCEDFGLDPVDADFGNKVNAICRERSRASTDGDKRLIELCKRARVRLEKDRASIDRVCDLTAKFEQLEPERPTYTSTGYTTTESLSAAEMRRKLPSIRELNHKSIVAGYRARIAKVAAYEKERDRLRREIGLTHAEKAHRRTWCLAGEIVADIAELPATTAIGLAHKGAILCAWKAAGNELFDEGEALALSIAEDARMLGTGGQVTSRHRHREQPSAQVH